MLNRVGKLSGNLNAIQLEALRWLTQSEHEEQQDRDKLWMQVIALAANEHANPDLLKQLMEEGEEVQDESVEWISPENEEEMQEMIRVFQGL